MRQAWSWSRLNLAEQCLRKYFLQNILKVPNMAYVQSDAALRGERIHGLFEAAAKKILAIKTFRETQVGKCPEPNYPEEIYKYIKTIYKLIDLADDIIIENNTAVDFDDNVVSYFDKKTWLRYAIDFGIRKGNKAILIDWKTGKNWGPSDQLKLFAAITMRYIWKQVDTVEPCYMFVDTGEMVREVYHRKDLDDMWADFDERVDKIQMAYDNQEWPAMANRFCRNCTATADQCEEKR